MTIRRRTGTLTTGGAGVGGGSTGTASIEIGLGSAYGEIIGLEFKGDDANVDSNNTLDIVDADGRIILKATALDAGTDDSTLKSTEQVYSTVGVAYSLVYDEARALQGTIGAVTTDNVGGGSGGVIARSPVTISIAAGTDGDVQKVHLFVRD